MSAIELADIFKSFKGKRGRRVQALKGLNLRVEEGEVFGFLGPNGAGKSTTIKILMGLIRADSGMAKINGAAVTESCCRRSLGYLPENPAFYEFLSAAEYLRYVGRAFSMTPRQIATESEKVLTLLQLWDARNRPMRGYSKGMVQRLGLAQVLLHDPDVYILDEPMSGLDPLGRALVKQIILDLKRRGKCVFFSTHITADVECLCDRVGMIVNGELQRVENVQTLMREGITGYQVLFTQNGAVQEEWVGKSELTAFVTACQEQGGELSLVEPQRKHLEEYFLETVRGKDA